MRVETLYVRHFRGLEKQEFHFSQGVNELVGANGEGKTSLLEALHLLILGSSFRTNQLRDLIKHEETVFYIEASVNISGVMKNIALQYDGTGRQVFLDAQLQETSSSLLGNLLGVTTTPEDQELVFGPPAIRRRFLDEQIAQIDPFYLEQLKRYTKALSQRNVLLKKHDFLTMSAWEEQLAKAGAYIVTQRRATLDLLSPLVQKAYHALFPAHSEGAFMSKYSSQPPVEEENVESWYLKQYATKRDYESRVGATLTGPHRDDLEWTFHERPLRAIASLGQARAVALSLRLAEWQLLYERSREHPIFLVDDCESSLDGERRAALLSACAPFEQIFITAHQYQSPTSHKVQLALL